MTYPILPPHSQDHTRLADGLDRYYKLAVEISGWKRATGDDKGVEQFKVQRDDEAGVPKNATAAPGKDPMPNDEDSATHCTFASEILKRNQAAVEKNSEHAIDGHWMPDDGVLATDVLGCFVQDGQVELEEVYGGNAEEESEDEGILAMLLPNRDSKQGRVSAQAVLTNNSG